MLLLNRLDSFLRMLARLNLLELPFRINLLKDDGSFSLVFVADGVAISDGVLLDVRSKVKLSWDSETLF